MLGRSGGGGGGARATSYGLCRCPRELSSGQHPWARGVGGSPCFARAAGRRHHHRISPGSPTDLCPSFARRPRRAQFGSFIHVAAALMKAGHPQRAVRPQGNTHPTYGSGPERKTAGAGAAPGCRRTELDPPGHPRADPSPSRILTPPYWPLPKAGATLCWGPPRPFRWASHCPLSCCGKPTIWVSRFWTEGQAPVPAAGWPWQHDFVPLSLRF